MRSGWATDGPAIPASFQAASCSGLRSRERWCMRGLILADEPTGNLDPDTAAQIIALLGRTVRERGAAMLLVTHAAGRGDGRPAAHAHHARPGARRWLKRAPSPIAG